jgi:hypothetical protein
VVGCHQHCELDGVTVWVEVPPLSGNVPPVDGVSDSEQGGFWSMVTVANVMPPDCKFTLADRSAEPFAWRVAENDADPVWLTPETVSHKELDTAFQTQFDGDIVMAKELLPELAGTNHQ